MGKHRFGGISPDITKSTDENVENILDMNVLLALIVSRNGGRLRVTGINKDRVGPPMRLVGKWDDDGDAITLEIIDVPEAQ